MNISPTDAKALQNFTGLIKNNNSCIYQEYGELVVNTNCIQDTMCKSLSDYMIYNGLLALFVYVLFKFVITYYFRTGYKKFPKLDFLKLGKKEFMGRLKIYELIHHYIDVFMFVYIAMTVYLFAF